MKILRLFFILLILMNSAVLIADEPGYNQIGLKIVEIEAEEPIVAGDIFSVELEVTNVDEFVGFGLDIPLPDGFGLVTGSFSLTDRADGHLANATIVEDNTLRIVAYHEDLDAFKGNTGAVATFQLTTPLIPADYDLEIVNGILSDELGNELELEDPEPVTITLRGNEITIVDNEVKIYQSVVIDVEIDNFQEFTAFWVKIQMPEGLEYDDEFTPVFADRDVDHLLQVVKPKEENDYQLTLYGYSEQLTNFLGNKGTVVSFGVVGDEGGEQLLEIIEAFIVDDTGQELDIEYNHGVVLVDDENTVEILAIEDGLTNEVRTIELLIDNALPFTGFEVDIHIPEGFGDPVNIVGDSERFTDHIISTDFDEEERILKILAYSTTLDNFEGFEGTIATFDIKLPAAADDYILNILSAILVDDQGNEYDVDHIVHGEIKVSQLVKLALQDTPACSGQEVEVDLHLYNSLDVIAFQTKIHIPEEFDYVGVELNEDRAPDFVLNASFNATTGILSVLCFSNDPDDVILGAEGRILTIHLDAPSLSEGDVFDIALSDSQVLNVDAEDLGPDEEDAEITTYPEPFVYFEINEQTAVPGFSFEFEYDELITVVLSDADYGTEPFTIVYEIEEEDGYFASETVTVNIGDEIFSQVMPSGIYTIRATHISDYFGCEISEEVLEEVYYGTVIIEDVSVTELDIVNLLDMTGDNLPTEIGSGGNARSAAIYMDRYVVVPSREGGPNVWVWDRVNPHLDPFALEYDTEVIEPLTFPINYVRTAGDAIYVSNLSLNPAGAGWAQGVFQIYRWDGLDASPEIVVSYDAEEGRLGDAFSIIGDPKTDGHIIANINTVGMRNQFRVWTFEDGELINEDEPGLITLDVDEGAVNNHAIYNAIPGEEDLFVVTSNLLGILIANIDGDVLAEISTDVVDQRAYDPSIFYYDGVRYLSYTINNEGDADVGAVYKIVDINVGDDVIEGFEFISTSDILEERTVHSRSLGAGHVNLTAINQVVFDEDGEAIILAHVVGRGFVLETTGDLPTTYALTLEVEPEEAGTVEGAGEYQEGATVPLSATPAGYYQFVNWTDADGDEVSDEAEFHFTMPAMATTLTANFEEIPIVEVATLLELRGMAADGTIYLYTGDAVIVAMDGFRNRKFLQDETAAIMIDDNPGVITTEYDLYDVITNVRGRLNVHNQLLQFQPDQNTEPAEENTPVMPTVFALDEVTSDDQAKLIRFEGVHFVNITDGQVFANGTNYTLSDGEETFVVRTDFWNVDYIGEEIPTSMVNINGVIIQFHGTLQLVPRFAADIEEVIYITEFPWLEDFEGEDFPPLGWNAINVFGTDEEWELSDEQNHTPEGSQSAFHDYGPMGVDVEGWLITPGVVVPEEGIYHLSFWSYNIFPSYYSDGKNSVWISDGSANPFDGDYVEIWSPESVTNEWVETVLDLEAYAGDTIYIAFVYEGVWAHGWHLDDVMVYEHSPAFEVTFNVDLTKAIEFDLLEGFDPDVHHIFMTGNMFGWAEPGTLPEQTMEKISDDPYIYSLTLHLEAGEYLYKYFSDLLGDGWDGGEWPGDPNRVVDITEDTVINDMFGPDDISVIDTGDITFNLYPVPARSMLNIEASTPITDIRMVDMLGQVVYSAAVNDHRHEINVSGFKAGIYFVQMTTSAGVVTHRVQVTN